MRTAVLITTAMAAAFTAAAAFAKLPPLSEEAKAKAAEAAAKTAWTDKVGAYKTCLAMDRAAQNYRGNPAVMVKTAPTPGLQPCGDPGPFAATPITPPANKPLEASGAHSPPGAAVTPPSQKSTASEIAGGVKKPAPN